MASLPALFEPFQAEIGRALETFVPDSPGSRVVEAMRYTLLAPSKRVRAILAMFAADVCSAGGASRARAAACAIEAIHAASLMLDDLPSMDNAPLRRGRPSAHIAFGEAVTILAAFGLLNAAFASLARSYEPPLAARLAGIAGDAIGLEGLVAGQAEDVLATDASINFDTLERIHRRKTGALFGAAAVAGGMTAGGNEYELAALSAYAKNLGLAFQIVDDLLDVTGDPAETGKATRTDARKTTFVSFSGVAGARQLAGELCDTAIAALAPFGSRATALTELARFVAARRL
jgi:geranylgeranyl diphosphate synthase type II